MAVYHLGAMMLVRLALIIHDNGAIVCIVRKQVGRHSREFKERGEEEEEGFNWVGGKGLVDFYYGYNVLRVMLCYALTRGVLGGWWVIQGIIRCTDREPRRGGHGEHNGRLREIAVLVQG